MNRCLRCGKTCEQGLFCENCQSALLRRSVQTQETHEALAPASLGMHVSLSEPNSRKSAVLDSAVQASSSMSAQDIIRSREQDRLCNTSGKVSLPTEQSPKPRMSSLSLHDSKLTILKHIFIIMAIITAITMVIDSILISLVIYHHRLDGNHSQNVPIVSVANGTVYLGEMALLHISHFPAKARVLLHRDIEDQVHLDTGSPLVQMSSTGAIDAHILVEGNWGVGNHLIEAEDINTHYVASTVIQVMGSGPAQHPHVQVSQNELDLGADLQGANTLQSLTLENTGDGMISWTASSNQPWLFLTPMMGIFDVSQRVVVAVNRFHLKPGTYLGTITFVANNSVSIHVDVKMSVLPIKNDLGAILVISPPVLSFIATDGGPDPAIQLLTVSNPGSRPLYWSLGSSAPPVSTDGKRPFIDNMNWLGVKPTSGVVAPGLTTSIHFTVSSRTLLPGVYSSLLTFTGGQDAFNNPQSVAVSLNIQPRCGVMASTGNISSSIVAGQKNPTSQSLALSLSPGCSRSVAWQASSMEEWLVITPSSGRVKWQADSLTTLTVNGSKLRPGMYTSFLVFLTDRRTQTVAVHLTVLASPGKSAGSTNSSSLPMGGTSNNSNGLKAISTAEPALGVSPTSMTFSVAQGENNPPSQAVTVVNTGGDLLNWQARTDTTSSSWLQVSPGTGSVASGQNGDIFLNVNTGSLSVGTYRSNVVISATGRSGTQVPGSPQVVAVVLNVVQSCTLKVTPTSLTFSASLLAPEPSGQDITLQTVGNCAYPVTWTATVDAESRSWLIPSVTSGQDSGNGSVMTVHVNTSGMLLGFYRGQILVSAIDKNGASVGNTTPTIGVELTVVG